MINESLQKELYVKIVNEGMDAEEATDNIMDEWESAFSTVDDQPLVVQLFGLVRPLINDKAKRIYRNHTRALEDRVFSDQPMKVRVNRGTGEVTESEDFLNWHEAQKRLVERSFNLPDGRWVRYRDSTPEDHESRARWQRGRSESIAKDANRHEALAKLMRLHGADHLSDVDIDLWKGLISS